MFSTLTLQVAALIDFVDGRGIRWDRVTLTIHRGAVYCQLIRADHLVVDAMHCGDRWCVTNGRGLFLGNVAL